MGALARSGLLAASRIRPKRQRARQSSRTRCSPNPAPCDLEAREGDRSPITGSCMRWVSNVKSGRGSVIRIFTWSTRLATISTGVTTPVRAKRAIQGAALDLPRGTGTATARSSVRVKEAPGGLGGASALDHVANRERDPSDDRKTQDDGRDPPAPGSNADHHGCDAHECSEQRGIGHSRNSIPLLPQPGGFEGLPRLREGPEPKELAVLELEQPSARLLQRNVALLAAKLDPP